MEDNKDVILNNVDETIEEKERELSSEQLKKASKSYAKINYAPWMAIVALVCLLAILIINIF